MIDKKEKKKIMTDLAAGHITQEEADLCLDIDEAAKDISKKTVSKEKKSQKKKLNPGGK